jgi:EmrB/QacA subfamily drug resistance transporter
MILLDQTVVSVALPTIQRDLDMSQTSLQWVVNAYLLAIAALVAVGGRLSDMFNRVGVLIVGVAIFVTFSAACGLAQSDSWLVASRVCQGIGAALMVPPTAAILMATFGPSERGRAMGIYAGVSMIFLSLGPLIGGLLTEHASWRWVFLINLPVGLATIAMVIRAKAPGAVAGGQSLDWPGVLTLVPGLAAVVLALMESNSWGWGDTRTLSLLAGGLVLLTIFVFVERRATAPLVELRLFRVRNFSGDSLVLFFVQFALIGMTIFGAIYIQDLLGYDPVEAGLALLPLTIPILVVAPIAGRLFDRIGPRALAASGALAIGLAQLWNASVLHEFSYPLLVPGYVLAGVGIGLVMSPTTTDAMSVSPGPLRGQASGVLQTVRQVGGTVGLAIVGAIVAHVQDASVAEGPRLAMTDGIAAAYYTSGGILVVTAMVAWAVLRRVRYEEGAVDPAAAVG